MDLLELTVETSKRSEAIDITVEIKKALGTLDPSSGLNVWVPHTTAGITVNESADPNVMTDLINQLEDVIPWNNNYQHIEANAAAHIKSILLGSHQWLPVVKGQLKLGRWQGVFLLEWDGPRTRTVEIYAD